MSNYTPTYQPTRQPTETASYRGALSHLKRENIAINTAAILADEQKTNKIHPFYNRPTDGPKSGAICRPAKAKSPGQC